MRVLAERPVLAMNLTGFLIGIAMFGSFLLIPQFAQTPESSGYGFGMTTLEAGLLMLPSSIAMLIAGPLGGAAGQPLRLPRRALPSARASPIAVVPRPRALAHETVFEFVSPASLIGVGIAFAFASMANLIVGAVDPSEVGIATGINTIMRTIGGAFGSAIVAALLTADTIPGTPFPTEGVYTEAFVFSTIGAVLALAAALSVPRIRRGGVPAPATA